MSYTSIELDRDGDVAIIRLNDPATLNAVTLKTIEEMVKMMAEYQLAKQLSDALLRVEEGSLYPPATARIERLDCG